MTAGTAVLGVRIMLAYRIYTIARDGHLFGVPKAIECSNDEEAIQTAKHALDGRDIEVWQHARLVARLPHKDRGG